MGKEITKQQIRQENKAETEGLYNDACVIIEQAQVAAYRSLNETLIKRNWLLGMRIQHEVLKDKRAEYGERVMKNLAEKLTDRYGKGFIQRNLHHFVDFYCKHPGLFFIGSEKSEIVNAESSQLPILVEDNIVNAVSSQFHITEDILHAMIAKTDNIFHAVNEKTPIRFSWTHYRIILQESSKEAREWYAQKAAREILDDKREIFRLQK